MKADIEQVVAVYRGRAAMATYGVDQTHGQHFTAGLGSSMMPSRPFLA